jgi:hypothetical protein
VIFERLEGLPDDPAMKAQPSLVRRWKELLEDYANDFKHGEFLMACHDLDALNFARHKYEQIRQMQGQDEIADRMIARVDALQRIEEPTGSVSQPKATESKYEPRVRTKPSVDILSLQKNEPKAEPPKWMRFVLMAPFAISFLLILLGVVLSGQRNMIGTGIAVALLSYGLITGLRGPLKMKDFLS